MKCFFPFKSRSAPEPNRRNKPATNSGSKSLPASSPRSINEMYRERKGKLRVFSFSELRAATNNFNKLLKIGEGGFGSVYKGTVSCGDDGGASSSTVVAIKKLNKNGLQGHKEWLAEVQFLGVVDHPNLVKLLGYCSVDREKGPQRLLVYEYMPNKSLEDHLFNRSSTTLPWKTRLDIILDAARGLAYLHEGLEVQVIFRDFKTSNVLLDVDFKPKLSDFGLAREGPVGDRSHVSTGVYGTLGYADPGYVDSGHLTVKSDIYSFGVVLYEILTGRRTIERFCPENEKKLLEWVKQFPVDGNTFNMIIDPRLRHQYSLRSARKIARLAETCLNKNAKERPMMSEVVKSLEEIVSQDSENGSNSEIASHKQLFALQVGTGDIERKAIPLPQPKGTLKAV